MAEGEGSIARNGTRPGPDGATARRLRGALERLRARALRERFVEGDPLASVLAYSEPADQEVAGLLAALLAYGRVDLLLAHARDLLALLGPHPAETLRAAVPRVPRMAYRFHRTRDLRALLAGTRAMLLAHGRLGTAFHAHFAAARGDLREGLAGFAAELSAAAGKAGPGLRFLLADPRGGGACKRWNLYLRWMVRKEDGDPDPGPWSDLISPSVLRVPLDTHIARIGTRLGFTTRRSADWRMVEEITAALRRIDPVDPIRYDFPLCHLGIRGGCPARLTPEDCRCCPLCGVCPTGIANAGSAPAGGRGRLDRMPEGN